jgi:hypothetical protein
VTAGKDLPPALLLVPAAVLMTPVEKVRHCAHVTLASCLIVPAMHAWAVRIKKQQGNRQDKAGQADEK